MYYPQLNPEARMTYVRTYVIRFALPECHYRDRSRDVREKDQDKKRYALAIGRNTKVITKFVVVPREHDHDRNLTFRM